MHNLVLLIGRLVNEPELVKTETGKKVLTIRLAVQRTQMEYMKLTLLDVNYGMV